ncbi:exported protein [Mycolicibacterium conceptionense]|uniref:Exported protein n=1 Tax=Mycolicibacterium conceptionense TaxID=451644 RepID=A0A0U1DD45_9MYCO|nr:exported protein [Mycolicibacterium conceptionense]
MQPTNGGLRRGLAAALAVTGVGGAMVAAFMVPSATAATDPCAASEVAARRAVWPPTSAITWTRIRRPTRP